MKIFIDTAEINEIKKAFNLGVLDGVTTNPSLISNTGKPLEFCIKEILEVIQEPVSVEVLAGEYKTIIAEAKEYVSWGDNVVVKVPITQEGLKATKALASEGIMVNVTLCFSPIQALLAAKAGAAYISPFVGRLDDISYDGIDLIKQILNIYSNYAFNTEVLVASIRYPLHIVKAALIGANIVTIPPNVIDILLQHPLTNSGLKQFLNDWEKRKI